jgi:hypothetical protein
MDRILDSGAYAQILHLLQQNQNWQKSLPMSKTT